MTLCPDTVHATCTEPAPDEDTQPIDEHVRSWYDEYCRKEELWYQEQQHVHDVETDYWGDLRRYEFEMHLWMHQSKERMDALDSCQPQMPHSPYSADLAAPSFTEDDRHVMAKHSVIYPQSEELHAVQEFINTTERALTMLGRGKLRANSLLSYSNSKRFPTLNTICLKCDTDADSDGSAEDSSSWESCGIVRTGAVAKGLLLHGEKYFDLVIVCKDKPTRWNVTFLSLTLPEQLRVAAQGRDRFTVTANPNDATIKVMAARSKLWINITLTSPEMREDDGCDWQLRPGSDLTPLPADVLDRQKCLKALAAVRQTKWLKTRKFLQKSFIIVLRVMRDLCDRVDTWKPLQGWVIELLCDKAILSSIRPLGVAEALRRVFECLAAGMLHKDKPGISDPCEMEPKDVLDGITTQQKEDITKSAQHALRLIAFGRLQWVLGTNTPPVISPSDMSAFTVEKRKAASTVAAVDCFNGIQPCLHNQQVEKKTKAEVAGQAATERADMSNNPASSSTPLAAATAQSTVPETPETPLQSSSHSHQILQAQPTLVGEREMTLCPDTVHATCTEPAPDDDTQPIDEHVRSWYDEGCRKEELWYQEQQPVHDVETDYWGDLQRYEFEMHLWMHQSKKRMDALDSCQPQMPRSPYSADLAAPSCTEDDRHVMAKHSVIYPQSEELQAVQSFINTTERALTMLADGKLSSDRFPSDSNSKRFPFLNTICLKCDTDSDGSAEDSSSWESCGIVRTGAVAKGLLLHGEKYFDLVIICKDKPTRWNVTLLSLTLPEQLKVAAQGREQFMVTANPNDATIKVMAVSSKLWINITLTSPAMREDEGCDWQLRPGADMTPLPADVLDRQKCLKALAAVRQTKWFQTRKFFQKSFIIVLRVMRDLCNRVPTWKRLQGWVIELLCEKAILTSIRPMGPAEALRRVFECLAAGMLHKDKPGILDPCEMEPKDVLDGITTQQKEDITKSAQHALRLIADGRLQWVLGTNTPPVISPSHMSAFTVKKRKAASTVAAVDCFTGIQPCLHNQQVEKKTKAEVAGQAAPERADMSNNPASSSAPLAAATAQSTVPEIITKWLDYAAQGDTVLWEALSSEHCPSVLQTSSESITGQSDVQQRNCFSRQPNFAAASSGGNTIPAVAAAVMAPSPQAYLTTQTVNVAPQPRASFGHTEPAILDTFQPYR